MGNYTISTARFEELDFMLHLAKEEGWNPGLEDAGPFYAQDPKGYFIGKLGDTPIGCISAVAYNDSYGFIGLYIVLKEYRGKGYGLRLWNHAMDYLGSRTIGLDGVVAQQYNYKKSGFNQYCRNIRFQGVVKSFPQDSLTPLERVPFEELLAYDTPIFGLERGRFLKEWISMPNAYGVAKMEHNRLQGYGLIRKCDKGYKIGPLFANSYEVGKEIFLALSHHASGSPLILDVPEVNDRAMRLSKEFNLEPVFETARMYNKTPPLQQLDKVLGCTTFELG